MKNGDTNAYGAKRVSALLTRSRSLNGISPGQSGACARWRTGAGTGGTAALLRRRPSGTPLPGCRLGLLGGLLRRLDRSIPALGLGALTTLDTTEDVLERIAYGHVLGTEVDRLQVRRAGHEQLADRSVVEVRIRGVLQLSRVVERRHRGQATFGLEGSELSHLTREELDELDGFL